ncbi:hypothetical protein Goshw_016776 [Gossypium schwendimanii]|uniref:Uncharacterized protein n=1 Tax=Gossypium schwendimanii TaxID=34291 RepID=A0A7J9NAJ7_GOSSC|nr:hypothetical protein [Gossypium schwendimanii]
MSNSKESDAAENGEENGEISLLEDDVQVSMKGQYPEINFSKRVHELTKRSMSLTIIVTSLTCLSHRIRVMRCYNA